MLKSIIEMLKVIIKLLGILIAIPTLIIAVWLAKAWFYDSIPKTKIPVASELFLKQLPGFIIWDASMLSSPEVCETYKVNCKVFFPNLNRTFAMTPSLAKKYQKKYSKFCEETSHFPASPNKRFHFTSSQQLYDQKTKQYLPSVTENRVVEAIDWSPDSRYILYRVEYNNPYPEDGQNYLYIVTDLKTKETYRIIKDPEMRMDTCWVSN